MKASINEKINNSGFLNKLFGTSPNDGDIQASEGLWYSVCGFGQNFICTIIGSYLTIFMTDAIGFGALSVALLMLFARLFDAFNDPIMGSLVDKTRTKWGKCRPYLKWMAIPIALMTILCFLPVFPSSPGGFAAVAVIYILWSMLYTVADVPYWALATAMTNNTTKRGNMLTIARLFCTAGAGLVTIIVPQVTRMVTESVKNSNLDKTPEVVAELTKQPLALTYFIFAVALTLIALPLFYIGFKNTKERMVATKEVPSFTHNIRLLFKNTPLLLIVLSGVLGSATMAYTYTGGLYFAKYVLTDTTFLGMSGEGLYTVITLAVVPGGLIASLLVPYFTKKFGKRNTYIVSHLIGGVTMFIMFFVGYKSAAGLIIALIGLVIVGIPQGFSNVMTYAMIGDTVEYLEWKTGERAEGICFAMQTLINKIGMAVGAFIGVLAYHMAGVSPNNPGALDAKGKDTLWLMLVLIGAISMVLKAVPMFFYKFNEKEQRMAVEEIMARNAAMITEDGAIMEQGGESAAESVDESADDDTTF